MGLELSLAKIRFQYFLVKIYFWLLDIEYDLLTTTSKSCSQLLGSKFHTAFEENMKNLPYQMHFKKLQMEMV